MGMAAPRVALAPLVSPSSVLTEVPVTRTRRASSIGWAACFGWYLALTVGAWADAAITGQPAALAAVVFVGVATITLLRVGGWTAERAALRSLLMGLIGLCAGMSACVAAPSGSAMAAEFLCFGVMSMLLGVLAALPPSIMFVTPHISRS